MALKKYSFDRGLSFLTRAHSDHDIEPLWRARALQGTNVILTIMYLIVIGFILATRPLGDYSTFFVSCILAPSALMTLFSLWMTYQARFLFFNIHLTLAALFFCAAVGIYVNGGPAVSSNNQHLIIQVVISFFLAGIRGGVVWLVIIAAVETFYFGLAASGYSFPNYQLAEHVFSGEVTNFFLSFFMVSFIVSLMELNRSSLDRYRELERSRFQYKATHDSLTQLANRELLYSSMAKAVKDCRRSGGRALLLYLDLNNFKPINDDFGHACGDRVLQIVASRLQSMVRINDVVARVGGDEFAILFQRVEPGQSPEHMTTALAKHLNAPINLFGQIFSVGCSIGICEIDGSNNNIDELLAKADNAMYQAKQSQQLWALQS